MSLQLGETFRDTLEYQELMARDLNWVLEVDVVYVLPGWSHSRGARAEVLVAQLTGKSVVEFETGKPTGSQVRTTVDARLFDDDAVHDKQCPHMWASSQGGARCSLPMGHRGPHDEVAIT